ncbi:hypothetical protein [Desulfobacter sp.]|uniref:hypothetical protein n=1 Tax=Desulfobacter sp. TaxID=2294 RepID=UPI003D096BB8
METNNKIILASSEISVFFKPQHELSVTQVMYSQGLSLGAAPAPVLSGPDSGQALQEIAVEIENYSPFLTYAVHVTGGAVARDGNIITWTLPETCEVAAQVLIVTTRNNGFLKEGHAGHLVMMEE